MISHRMSAGFAVPLGADMADGQGLAIGAGNRPGRRYGPGAPARGSRWPARWRASGWCGDGVRDASAVAGLLKRFLVGCAGQRAAARPDPVTEADRVAGVLQVLADRDRIARDPYEHVIGWLCGIGLAVHGTQHLAKSPAVAARIANHIDQLNDVITEIRTAVFDLHTDPADTPRRAARYTTSSRRSPRTPSRARSNDRTNVTIFGSGNMGTAVDVTIEAVGGARRPSR